MPGIGPVTAAGLRARGVERVAQLLALPERMLRHTFGLGLVGVLRGLGNGAAEPLREEAEAVAAFGAGMRARPKSIGHETTFARDVLDGKEGARERYLAMLEAGGSEYPYELLKNAGVDLATPAPYDALIARMNAIMDEIEALLDARGNTPSARR